MTNNVSIGGATVDADDPCALAKVLVAVRLRVLAGESVVQTSFGDFNSTRSTRWSQANLPALDREIARQQDLCQQAQGGRKKRSAIRAGFRRIP